jgi:succinate-semialdehyde dehydrogenase/glutarate-semialdehyde dehydrogenase
MNNTTTINPFNGQELNKYEHFSNDKIQSVVNTAENTFNKWKLTPLKKRAKLLRKLGDVLNKNIDKYSQLITLEMGKPISESRAEINKCILLCDFYEKNARHFLSDQIIETEAHESFISYDPLGVILAIMPWNYPFWQVFRFAVPTLTAGNTALLKHSSNVTGCSLIIQDCFEQAGYPIGCFQTVLTNHETIEDLIKNEKIKAVSLTGSEKAGISIAKTASSVLKKSVLELGGNNACIILDDADLDKYLNVIVKARFQNSGQSCIAAKRFIVTEGIYNTFVKRFKDKVESLKFGDPLNESTEIATLARTDLANDLNKQVQSSIKKGAKVLIGNKIDKTYFAPTILTEVTEEMSVFKEETFGPVAPITKAKDLDHAIALATNSRFGLGTMIFTKDIEKAKQKIIDIPDGAFFINDLVKSDPRLPFGGTKASGSGRELSKEGIHEFVNTKTVYINK